MLAHMKVLAPTTVLVLLSACGSGSSSSQSGSQYPLNDSVSAFMQMDSSYALSAESGTDSYSLQLSRKAGSQKSFQGTPAFTSIQTMVIVKNGGPSSTSTTTDYFLLGPYKKLGSVDSDGHVTVASDQAALPDQAMVGQSGSLDREDTYLGSPGGPILTRTLNTWALDDGTTTITAQFFENSAINGEAAMPQTESIGYGIDTKGNVRGVIVSIPLDGKQVTFHDLCMNCSGGG